MSSADCTDTILGTEIDLESWLFPAATLTSNPNSFAAEDNAQDVDPKKILAKVLSLAYLNQYWPEGLVFVTRLVKYINILDFTENRWKSWSESNRPYEVTCTLDSNHLAESVEGIIHEASHLALAGLERICTFQTSEAKLYRHPWKPDAREARGALLAAHAFLNVSQWYLRLALGSGQLAYLIESKNTLASVGQVMQQLRLGTNLSPWGRLMVAILDVRHDILNKEIICQSI